MSKAKPKHYVNNKQLYETMVTYIGKVRESEKNGTPKPRVPEAVGKALFQISNRLATKPNFSGYTYKEEMISDGIENCLQYIDNFDPDKSKNPFAYFTQTIYFAFLRRIAKEKKQTYIRHKAFEKSVIFNEMFLTQDGEHHSDPVIDSSFAQEFRGEFIQSYEQGLKERREKTKQAKKDREEGNNE